MGWAVFFLLFLPYMHIIGGLNLVSAPDSQINCNVIILIYIIINCLVYPKTKGKKIRKDPQSHIFFYKLIDYRRKAHFSPYILFLPLLVPILKKRFPFWSLSLHQKQRKLTWQTVGINNTKLMSTWPKLIIKNIFWH